MAITLFVIAWLVICSAALSSSLKTLTDKVDVTVYLTTNATQAQTQALQKDLQALPQVANVTYISSDQALTDFQAHHKNDELIMQSLQELGQNPFGGALEVKAKDTSQYETIASFLQTQQKNGTDEGSAIDTVNFQQNKTAINTLSNFIQTTRKLGVGLTIFLGIVSVLIVFNTIRLVIYTARDEIGVMNIVGASHWYVRGPFMIEGVLYGIVSGVFVMLIMYPTTLWLGPASEAIFVSFNVFDYFVSAFPMLLVIVLGTGIALGSLSSYLAIRRYLGT